MSRRDGKRCIAISKRLTGAYRISFTAMMMALSLLFLYCASLFPTGRLTLFFISSAFIAPLAFENELGLGIIAYIGTSILGFLILSNKLLVVPYVLLFGHYGIGKYLFEKKLKKAMAFVAKWLYFNVFLGICLILVKDLLLTEAISQLPIWIIIVAAQVAFVIYDFAYSLVLDIYFKKIRKYLIRS